MHILINFVVNVSMFLEYHSTSIQDASSRIHAEFPLWLEAYVNDERNNVTNPYIRGLSKRPASKAISWNITKPRGHVEIETVEDEMPYQSNDMSPVVPIQELESLHFLADETLIDEVEMIIEPDNDPMVQDGLSDDGEEDEDENDDEEEEEGEEDNDDDDDDDDDEN
ncbi:hypothetical protein P8452_66126 [Trifolium repens]|nr:hypothetical protein P8452_66126 [Trifolium repens]